MYLFKKFGKRGTFDQVCFLFSSLYLLPLLKNGSSDIWLKFIRTESQYVSFVLSYAMLPLARCVTNWGKLWVVT